MVCFNALASRCNNWLLTLLAHVHCSIFTTTSQRYSEKNTWFIEKLEQLYRNLGGDFGDGNGSCSGITATMNSSSSRRGGGGGGGKKHWQGFPLFGKQASLNPPADLKDRYDVIMVDEMQDLSESQFSWACAHAVSVGCRVVAVGDPCQRLYSFR